MYKRTSLVNKILVKDVKEIIWYKIFKKSNYDLS